MMCTELVGHKIARSNHKSFFYLNHRPFVHFPLRPISRKVVLHTATPISKVSQKGQCDTKRVASGLHECHDISGHVSVRCRSDVCATTGE